MNIDPREIAKFEELASRWWDRESEFKPLHDINPLRVSFIDRYAGLRGKRVLDVGCGGGILAEAMAQRGAQVSGIDMGEAPLKVAQLHGLETGVQVNYERCTAEEFALKHEGEFDLVTCMEMLEHVPDPASVVEACARLTKPGGKLVFSTINRNPKSYLFAIVAAERLMKLVPPGTHEFSKFIQPAELSAWARLAGLQTDLLNGMTYNPLTKVYALSETDVSVNYLLAASKPV